jgi:hypothetical protein
MLSTMETEHRTYAGDLQIYDRVVYKVGRQREKTQKKNDKKVSPCYFTFQNVNLCSNT